MKLKMAFAVVGLSLFSATAWGTTCASQVGDTYTQLAAVSGGCTDTFTNYTITFSNFTADANGSNIVLNQVDFNNFFGIAGFQFVGSAGGVPSFTTLGYTATISNCTLNFFCGVDGVYQQASFVQQGNSAGTVTTTETAGQGTITLTPASSTFGPSNFSGVTSITQSSAYDGNNVLGNLESDFYTEGFNTTVPEPTTSLLMGGGLLGLGLLGRRLRRKA